MLNTILLSPPLHCSTSLHFTQLHFTTLIDTSLLSFTLHYPLIWLNPLTFPIVLFHLTSLNYTQYSSHLLIYFQNNGLLHCPKEPLTISLHFAFYSLFFLFFYFFTYPINSSLYFTLLFISTIHFTSLHFLLFIAFTSCHWFSLS